MRLHDKFFRAVFSQPSVLQALILERSPIALARSLDGPPLPMRESFVDGKLREHIADIVAMLHLRGSRRIIASCLVEHARAPGRYLLIQLLRYQAQLYERLSDRFAPGQLPPIVVFVVTNGRSAWRGATRFSELLARHRATRRLALDFEVIVVDVASIATSDLSPSSPMRGALLALKAATRSGRERSRLIEASLRSLASEPVILSQAIQYLAGISPNQLKSTLKKLSKSGEQAMETYATFYERIGRKKGLKEGLEQGLERGRNEGLRVSLVKVLRKRFKRVPTSITKRVAAADARELSRWFNAALDARSLKAVFPD
ncbi:MAG: Rpn family recombination-promoting nuclease/putative transposase [Archangium sp.]|nr:Rpn family recombination-promoting nuclease/putative transposase [Archangium sp.]